MKKNVLYFFFIVIFIIMCFICFIYYKDYEQSNIHNTQNTQNTQNKYDSYNSYNSYNSYENYENSSNDTSLNVLYSDMDGDIDYGVIIPSGTILMWNGVLPPTGWVLCDGKNDTPDLRGRFVLGTKSDMSDLESEDMAGGNSLYLTQEMVSHNHNVTANFDISKLTSLEPHSHHHDYVTVDIFPPIKNDDLYNFSSRAKMDVLVDGNLKNVYVTYNGYGCAPSDGTCYKVKKVKDKSEGISTQIDHNHQLYGLKNAVITPKKTDKNEYVQNKVNYNPPYYALAFIMKI